MGKIDLSGNTYNYLTVIKDDGTRDSDGSIKWLCECICGKQIHVRGYDLKKDRIQSCGCMRKHIIGLKSQKNISNQKFNKLTALYPLNEKRGDTYLWHCKCDCGNECDVSVANLTSGSVKSCGCLQKEKVGQASFQIWEKQRQALINTYINDFLILDASSKNGKTIVYAKCPLCGNSKWIKLADIKNKKTTSCGCRKSLGEAKIIELLNLNNIPFQREFKFQDCKDKNPLPFDFYINNQYIIEYDGIQHSEAQGGWNTKERLLETQIHDKIKNQYCFNNNIPIIRIPYTHYNELCLEDILLETSNFILKGEKINE